MAGEKDMTFEVQMAVVIDISVKDDITHEELKAVLAENVVDWMNVSKEGTGYPRVAASITDYEQIRMDPINDPEAVPGVVEFWNPNCRGWLLNGLLHKEDGPARIWVSGTKEWYFEGIRHRADGPAFTRTDGLQEWYHNGLLHREDGPAVTYPDGTKKWYIHGVLQPDPE